MAREEVQITDTQEIHTTETVLHQAQATLAAARLQEDTAEEAQASPEVRPQVASPEAHHQVAATAEVHHQEAIDDKNIKT